MNTVNLKRLQNEIKFLQNQDDCKDIFRIKMIDDNIYHWQAVLFGPQESIYEGYEFKLNIDIPSDYPISAPTIKFITPIEHMNINKAGDICLDILKANGWSPTQSIKSLMISIRLLLSCPNPSDPFNSSLANLYNKNEKEYLKVIKQCCEKYAKPETN